MARDYNVGILGGGPAGCCVAYFLQNFCNVSIIDYKKPLLTLLPTGGGRCNLAHAEYDFKELAANYPRGEKFLYSIFSKFYTPDTLNMFEEIGIKTYTQEDCRIFPESNSAKDARDKFLKKLNKVKFIQEKGLRIEQINNKIKIVTDMNSYLFDSLVICIGGHSEFDTLKRIGIDIVPPKPSLVGLKTKENLKELSGTSVKNVQFNRFEDTLLFTHFGISGPLTFKISSIKARDEFPYKLNFNLLPCEFNLQDLLNKNPHKQINNLLAEYLPKKLADYLLTLIGVEHSTECHKIDGKKRDTILDKLHNFELNIISTRNDGEIVTAGGVDLKVVNNKTLESKVVPNLYFAGEVLDIDGFCGGFNLQNCWSTAFVVAEGIKSKLGYNIHK